MSKVIEPKICGRRTRPSDPLSGDHFNAVAGIRLPRNWEVGARLLLQTGTPVTTFHGYNTGRTVWDNWLLDFYVDVINSTVAEESGGLVGSQGFRYVLPTIGFRAVL